MLAGAFLGYSFITRYASIMSLPWFVLYVALVNWEDKKRIPGAIALLISCFGVFLLLQAGWNWYRFHSLLETGAKHQAVRWANFRGRLLVSLPALLVGLNRSIFVFSPPLILFFFAIRRFTRRYRLETMLLLGLVVTYLGFYGKFTLWPSLASWGPRFLVPITPLLALPLCLFINRVTWKRTLIYTLLAVAPVVQLIAVLLPLQIGAIDRYFGGIPKTMDYFTKSEIIPQAKALFAGNVELWFLDGHVKSAVGLVLLLLCIASGHHCIHQTIRAEPQKTSS